jgi:8-oxo-dGTP pyrophosphatase MutT (NUDIX family)
MLCRRSPLGDLRLGGFCYTASMVERYRIIPAVFIIVHDQANGDQQVLLQRRAGTGYCDGWYDAPSGHYEEADGLPQVAAARELEEETGLIAKSEDLELFHIVTNEHETPGKPYWYLVLHSSKVM